MTTVEVGVRDRGFLASLNPLAKLAAPVPAVVALLFVRDIATPLTLIVLSYALVLVGARMTRRRLLLLFVVVPVALAFVAVGFALWVDQSQVADTAVVWRIGGWTMHAGAFTVGLATSLRLGAILALTLPAGFSTTGPDLARSLVQQLRVPYRIGYTAIAAFRFVPRFAYELDVIRQAHRVRGAHGGRGPFSAIARWAGYLVPLLASAIRHAERVGLAMDARAFGAFPDRTERHSVPWRVRDTLFVIAFLAVCALVFWIFFPWGR